MDIAQPALNPMGKPFKQALTEWRQIRSLGKSPKSQETILCSYNIILRHWTTDPDLPVSQIQTGHVLNFAEKISDYGDTYWNNSISALRYICPQHGKLLKRRKVKIRDFTPLSQMEFKALLTALDSSRSRAMLVVRFLTMTGMRKKEAHGVRKSDVKEHGVFVRSENAKNGKPRLVPFVPGLAQVIERLKALPDTGEFLLPRADIRKAVTNACKRAGLPHMSYHCFRHQFATMCVESEVDVPTLAEWLGHKDKGALAMQTYIHVRQEHSLRVAQKVVIAA